MADLNELKRQAARVREEASDLRVQLHIDARETKLADVARRAEDPLLWNDPENAQQVMSEQSRRRNELEPWRRLDVLTEDALLLAEMAVEAEDLDSVLEIEGNLAEIASY